MRGQEQDQRRLIVRPRYSLACADLPTEPAAEQISFEYTIYHLTAGVAELTLDGLVYPISSPGYAFILPGKAYLLRSTEAASALSIRIKREFMVGVATEMGLESSTGELFFLTDTAAGLPILDALCRSLVIEVRSGLAGQQIALDAIITQILVQLLRDQMGVRSNQQLEISRVGVVDRRLRRAIEYIHAHYSRELSLTEIAQAAFLSEYHFSRLFKRVTGLTPHHYLAAVRIEQARLMLAETDLSIVAVSSAIGYSSQSHFTKIFRNLTGFTPAEYREYIFLNHKDTKTERSE
jgi:AraC family transcriptional regulator